MGLNPHRTPKTDAEKFDAALHAQTKGWLTKKQQGNMMGAFRELQSQGPVKAVDFRAAITPLIPAPCVSLVMDTFRDLLPIHQPETSNAPVGH